MFLLPHVSSSRVGSYLATGYANGTTAVHSLLSRSLVSLYPSFDGPSVSPTSSSKKRSSNAPTTTTTTNGITSVSWARRSRTLLTGTAGDHVVRLLDLTHPLGPEKASLVTKAEEDQTKEVDADDDEGKSRSTPTKAEKTPQLGGDSTLIAPRHGLAQTKDTAFCDTDNPDIQLVTEPHKLESRWVTTASVGSKKNRRVSTPKLGKGETKRPRVGKHFPALSWSFGEDALLGGALQVHPTVEHAGLATFQDGRLVVFYISPDAWYKNTTGDAEEGASEEEAAEEDKVHLLTLTSSDESYSIASAAISPSGEEILAITKDGYILGWKGLEEKTFWKALDQKAPAISTTPSVVATISAKPTLWQILISRNGQQFVVNAADGILRLYMTSEFWKKGSQVQPVNQFQDVVNKIKFSSCDFSGDGEYLVGGVNGNDNRYELHIWSTATGLLVDTLRGVAVQLFAVAWHPNRALLAAATSDGLVDLWGPRINWTAFAPDFQALPRNVEYVEREDEFDQTKDGSYVTDQTDSSAHGAGGAGAAPLDVKTIVPSAAFASDSEDETEVFNFELRVSSATVKQQAGGRFKNADKSED